jgi:outer membrane protein
MKQLLLLLFLLPLSVVAQNKLAFVTIDEVFSKMPELKEVETKMATKTEAVRKNIESMEAELQKKLKEFEDMPAENKTQAITADYEKQVQDLHSRYQTFVQSSQQELEKEQQTLLAPLQQKMMKAIKDVGDENGYSLILNSNAILHVGADVKNVNDQVKTKLGITN